VARRNRQVVFFFREGDPTALQTFGGKGANLVKMRKAQFPVPPGFIVSTSVSRAFQQEGTLPERLEWQLNRAVTDLEKETRLKFGGKQPLLVSVRSGAPVSMPGMMDTVLNVGMNLEVLEHFIAYTGDAEFGHDTYRRFLMGFGTTVLGFGRSALENQMEKASTSQEAWIALREILKDALTDDPREQLRQAIVAVCKSWDSPRARDYRSLYDISSQMGTAVVVQAMVFGNRGDNSGSGVVFSRDVATGARKIYGEFAFNEQGESLVAGSQTPEDISALGEKDEELFATLSHFVKSIEQLERDAVDVEFTVENGKLYILQHRVAKRTVQAAVRIAVDMVREGLITEKDAVSRFSKDELEKIANPLKKFSPLHDLQQTKDRINGLAASPGAACGRVCFTSESAQILSRQGERVILVLPETSPDDFAGMLASSAIVTSRGGTTCHAAVVARALGIPAVVGTGVVIGDGSLQVGNKIVREGDTLSVDGSMGMVVADKLDLIESESSDEAGILLGWKRKHEKLVDLDLFNSNFSVNTILNDMYVLETIRQEQLNDELRKEVEACYDMALNHYAQIFATYLLAAVAGELRHGWHHLSAVDRESLGKWGVFHTSDRTQAQVTTVKRLLEFGGNDILAEFCEIAERTFEKFHATGFGGRPWAVIAQTVRMYLAGDINQTLFVDRVFDLRHNNGLAFDKHPMVSSLTDRTKLDRQLDIKRMVLEPAQRIKALLGMGRVSQEVLVLLNRTYPNPNGGRNS